MTTAFHDSKQALAQAVMLIYPQPSAPVSLAVDASDLAIGGVLQQWIHNQWQPLAFFSKKLKTAEIRYSTFDRELLAMYLGVKHFKYFLESKKFIIFTDHKPLTFSMMKTAEPGSARQQRHLAFVSEFTTDIQHITGKDNVVADALEFTTDIQHITGKDNVVADALEVTTDIQHITGKDNVVADALEFTTDIQHITGKDNVVADALEFTTDIQHITGKDNVVADALEVTTDIQHITGKDNVVAGALEFTTDIQHITGKDNVVADTLEFTTDIQHITGKDNVVADALEFTTDIQHITGKDNEVADALSRRIHATSLGINFAKLAEEQHTDPDIRLLQEGDTGLNIQEIEFSPGVNLLWQR